MEYDLLFTLITKPEWKIYSSSGSFEPLTIQEKGFVQCYDGSQVEYAANTFFKDYDELFLIVIDPLRVQVPIKNEKNGDQIYHNLHGAFSIDAIIDRILVKRGENGSFSIRVKHFD